MTTWYPNFFKNNPLYAPCALLREYYQQAQQWLSLAQLNQWPTQQPVKFVPQEARQQPFERQYEPRIYLSREVQTRTENWHDFFNASVWNLFPKTKLRLNREQFHALSHRWHSGINRRSPYENYLTHFDECGLVVLSDDHYWLNLIRQHRWKSLFWEQRQQLMQHVQFIVFGHAIYESALNPFVGLTAKALLFKVPSRLLKGSLTYQIREVDALLQRVLDYTFFKKSPKLQPVPILGVPGWFAENNQENFYDNRRYFRSRPK